MDKYNILNALEQVRQNQTAKVEKTNTTFNPHLAVCHTSNPSANNRHVSLLIKSKDDATEIGLVSLVKSSDTATQIEMFCKSLADISNLTALYTHMKQNGHDDIINNILKAQMQK
ncbi:hypothetical protein [Aeromonas allosaccharophila]|uniref:hypothetical protein n=1 Tax=Aeromonas allosaccharophila TaxID=656 RepID=UPI001119F091|nr:hypothetical protein [Aeromonas allosaccharophila]